MKHCTRLAGLVLALAAASVLAGCTFEDLRVPQVRGAEMAEAGAPADEADQVKSLAGQGVRHERYIKGNKGFFQPEKVCTRAEIAQILCNLGLSVPGDQTFSDVDPAAWYAPAVTRLAGALRGYDDGTLRPFNTITFAELVTILCRAMDVELPKAAGGQPWYAPAVNAAKERGWLEGVVRFDPSKGADRASVVSICNRVDGRVPDTAAIDGIRGPVFLDLPKSHAAYYDILEASLDHSADWSKADVPALKPGLHALDGLAYYVKDDGTIYETPGLLTLGGETCLVSEDHGRIYADGAIHMVEGSPVFCTTYGTLLKNNAWHNFYFDANGRYTSGDAGLDKYVEALLAAETKPGMTQIEKLYACNCKLRTMGYLGRNEAYPNTVKTMPHSDAVAFAKKIYETGKGDCYNFAAAYYFAAKRLGFDAEAVIGTCVYSRWGYVPYPHAWLEIALDGTTYLFDCQIENNNIRNGVSNETNGAFKVTYANAPAEYIKN